MSDRNKIATELTAEQLQQFLDKCWKTPGLTLKKVQELAEGFGIEVSLMGAKSFRDTTFARHLQRLSKANELAEQVRALKNAGAGHTIADAAAAIISDEVMDKLINRDPDEELDLDVLSKIVKRLRDSDQRSAALQQRVREYEEKMASVQAGVEQAKSKGGLTPETLRQIEEAAKIL